MLTPVNKGINMKFGEFVRTRREQLGLTQYEFEGFGPSYISNIEHGKNRPTRHEIIERLAQQLQLPPNQVKWLWVYSLF